ncbi:hypothetical protein BD410DRAFT_790509 [Rickenella mellea]|uniref:F-box domain-containing protein n=1 Tax=Rickenella mellea TaxID=50990 RepID=A0A4Y7Q0I2_9AGAM|nr:hypothetical protein BD410DRAFT_790509 [Rickenella mellea]
MTLPPELLSQILCLACTDDGKTARALSLVSRSIHTLSAPFFFQSLAVWGRASTIALLARLKELSAHRRRVRHLFLVDCNKAQCLNGGSLPPGMDGGDDGVEHDTAWFERECMPFRHLLSLVAPTLLTLSVLTYNPLTSTTILTHPFSISFPHLQALTMHGFYPYPHVPSLSLSQSHSHSQPHSQPHSQTPTKPQTPLPSLKSLHLSGSRNPHGLLQIGALSACCPLLSHLRVSGLRSALSFAQELDAALSFAASSFSTSASSSSESTSSARGCQHGVSSGDAEEEMYQDLDLFAPRLPCTLTLLQIQPGPAPPPPPPSLRRSVSQALDTRMMAILHEKCTSASHAFRTNTASCTTPSTNNAFRTNAGEVESARGGYEKGSVSAIEFRLLERQESEDSLVALMREWEERVGVSPLWGCEGSC